MIQIATMPPKQGRRRTVSEDVLALDSKLALTHAKQRNDQEDSDENQRPRQRRNARVEDSNEGEDEAESDEDVDMDGLSAEQSADQLLAKKLIRYAIACDYSRTPIRRDGIKERGEIGIFIARRLRLGGEDLC